MDHRSTASSGDYERGRGAIRWVWIGSGCAFVGVVVWTAIVFATSWFPLWYEWPGARPAIEVLGLVVLGAGTAIAYARFSLSGSRALLLVALALLMLFLNHVMFLPHHPHSGLVSDESIPWTHVDLYRWEVGTLLAGVLFVAAAVVPDRYSFAVKPVRRFLLGAAVVVGALALVTVVLALLKPLTSSVASFPGNLVPAEVGGTRVRPQPSSTGYLLGLTTVATFVTASVLLLRSQRVLLLRWLPGALLVAAASQFQYIVLPPWEADDISSADVLRLIFYLCVLSGLVWEMRRVFLEERRLADRLEAAYGQVSLAERDLADRLKADYESEARRAADLQEIDRARTELHAMLSHELLHPVAAIRALALTLLRRWSDLDEAETASMLGAIDGESLRLARLAEQAAEHASPAGPPFPLAVLPEQPEEIMRAAEDAAPELSSRLSVVIEPGADLPVMADGARVLQVLQNLLSNAARYGDPGTPIELRLHADHGRTTFTVTTVGPPIAESDRPLLFQRFSRLRTGERKSGEGSGLGLYISWRIIEGHGGEIWSRTCEDGRTMFGFSIPQVGRPT